MCQYNPEVGRMYFNPRQNVPFSSLAQNITKKFPNFSGLLDSELKTGSRDYGLMVSILFLHDAFLAFVSYIRVTFFKEAY